MLSKCHQVWYYIFMVMRLCHHNWIQAKSNGLLLSYPVQQGGTGHDNRDKHRELWKLQGHAHLHDAGTP